MENCIKGRGDKPLSQVKLRQYLLKIYEILDKPYEERMKLLGKVLVQVLQDNKLLPNIYKYLIRKIKRELEDIKEGNVWK